MESGVVFAPAIENGPCNRCDRRDNQHQEKLHPEEICVSAVAGVDERRRHAEDVHGGPGGEIQHRP